MRNLHFSPLITAVVLAGVALGTTTATAELGDILHAIPTPGANPADLAWVEGELYSVIFAPTEQRGIYRLDPQTGNVLGMVPYAGSSPQGLTYDGHNLWQVCLSTDSYFKMHPVTGQIYATFPAPGGSDGQPIGLGWDGEYLWLADSRSPEKIWQIDTLGVVQGQIPAPGASPYGLAWAEGFIWVSDNSVGGLGYIYKLDPATGAILASFPCPGGGGSPNGITHDGEYLWIAVNTNDTIYQVDDGITGGAGVESAPFSAAALRLISARAEAGGRGVDVRLVMARTGLIRAQLFDVAGRMRAHAEAQVDARADAPSACELRVGATSLASGAYYVLVTGAGERATGTVIVVR